MSWLVAVCAVALTMNPDGASVSSSSRAHELSRAGAWFAAHTFCGINRCLTVEKGRRLAQGDRVLVFAGGQPARASRVSWLFDADSARRIFEQLGFDGVYADTALWNEIGCYWGLRNGDSPPASIARYEPIDRSGEGLPLAIEGLPSTALVLGGDGTALGPRELDALFRRLASSVPPAFFGRKVLRVGRRYGAGRGHELVELFLGRPAYSADGAGAPIDSIEICRLFVHGRRVLAVERFTRSSSREEHVDVEPPRLDPGNWYLTSEETVGYLSLDRGESWDRLSIDVGFEGVGWAILRLEDGLPRLWDSYLYLLH